VRALCIFGLVLLAVLALSGEQSDEGLGYKHIVSTIFCGLTSVKGAFERPDIGFARFGDIESKRSLTRSASVAINVPWHQARRDPTGLSPDPAVTQEPMIQVFTTRRRPGAVSSRSTPGSP
jgi:hypothetical protein